MTSHWNKECVANVLSMLGKKIFFWGGGDIIGVR